MSRRVHIGVMGPGRMDAEGEGLAREVGRHIAEAGCVLVCGGLGGAMQAASRGAHDAGGPVIGILPGFSPDDANPYVTFPVATGMSHARNSINIWTSDAVVAVQGSYGTLSEIALALKCGRPVVGLHTWDLASAGCDDPDFRTAQTPREAVELALWLARRKK